MSAHVTKVVIPAIGDTTPFLPATRTFPPEMLPLVEKPIIQHVSDEAVAASLSHVLCVTHYSHTIIARHFASYASYDTHEGHSPSTTPFSYTHIYHEENHGLGHAILQASHCFGKEPMAIALPHYVFLKTQSVLRRLIRTAHQEKASVIAVQEIPAQLTPQCDVISIKKNITPNLFQVASINSKPQPVDAPSKLAVVGRYVLSHKILQSLQHTNTYALDSVDINAAITHMIQQHERVFAVKIHDPCFRITTREEWLYANMAFAHKTPTYIPALQTRMDNNQRETHEKDIFYTRVHEHYARLSQE